MTKNYTSIEKTGKTAKQTKLDKVISKLQLAICRINTDFDLEDSELQKNWNSIDSINQKFFLENPLKGIYPESPKPKTEREYKLDRQQLTDYLRNALKCLDRMTVYNMINYLLAENFISRNPTSQITILKGVKLPKNDTKYKLNIDKIMNYEKGISTHSPLTLDSFNNEENQVSSELQKENMSKTN